MKIKRFLFAVALSLPLLAFSDWVSAIDKKSYQENGVTQDRADSEAQSASIVLGLNLGSFSLGEDPCAREAKHIFSPKSSKYGDISLGKLPGKPSVDLGKSGKAMEGESDVYPEEEKWENVCLEAYDEQGNKCVEARVNPDGTTTIKNTSDSHCVIELRGSRSGTVIKFAPNTEATFGLKPEEKSVGQTILNFLGDVRRWARDVTGLESQPETPTRTAVTGVRGQCDPYGVTGGCRVDKGSAWVIPSWLNPMDEILEAEKKGLVEKLVWQSVNPGSDSSANPPGGPTPSRTYPAESTKSGFGKEKESKVFKGSQIINPSGEKSTGHPAGFDFCGRHLPSPEEYARMGFDPGRITDPVDRSWNGRIEQAQNQRTLTWSKTMTGSDGSSVKVERRYHNGSLLSVSYQFFNSKGEKTGFINYDSRTGRVDGQRFK